MNVLLTGACGYIGSHTMLDLLEHGHQVVCVDDLSNSTRKPLHVVEKMTKCKIPFYPINICDASKLQSVFDRHQHIDAIIHFAASKYVNESTQQPLRYYNNNIQGLLHLLEATAKNSIPFFVFSSSCAVYGTPTQLPVTEDTSYKEAESPYALTKQIGEIILKDYSKYRPLSACLLRYFNPAGAHPTGQLGEWATQPQNLVPLIIKAAKEKKAISIFGKDYPTRDGTCVRDYIHVCDLARAHRLALEYMNKKMYPKKKRGAYSIFNIGTGTGTTVKEAITAFTKATGIEVATKYAPRRMGDVMAIYSDFAKAKQQLKWNAQYNITDIMQSAWHFEMHKK